MFRPREEQVAAHVCSELQQPRGAPSPPLRFNFLASVGQTEQAGSFILSSQAHGPSCIFHVDSLLLQLPLPCERYRSAD